MTYIPNIQNKTSIINSTNTPLTSGTSFTGEWEKVSDYDSIIVSVKTDQKGTFYVQFSPDGVNVDSSLTRYYRTTTIEVPHRFTITRDYVRIVYTNDITNQTYIRLQTSYGNKSDLNAPLDSTLSPDFDAIVTRPTDYTTEVALGRRQGVDLWNKFGFNSTVPVGTEVVASFGGSYTPLLSASTITLSSSDVNDTDGGSGAHGVVVYGVDENYLEQIEVILLSGTTNVSSPNQWLGINRTSLYRSGSSLGNEGTIDVFADNDLSQQAQIPIGLGTSQQCIFLTRAKHKALVTWMLINILRQGGGSDPIVIIKCWVYSSVSNSKYEVFRQKIDTAVENTIPIDLKEPFIIGEKSNIWIEATSTNSDTEVSVRFSLKEISDVNA